MNHQVKIERLKTPDIPEVQKLLIQAFKDYPLIPDLRQVKPELGQMHLKSAFDLCLRMRSALLYGIRKDEHLVSVSLSADPREKLPILPLIRFIFSMIRFSVFVSHILGWKKTKEVGRFLLKVYHKEKPKYKEPYLELVLFGTLPRYQGQGFGRKMLRFLYNEAKKRGYKGVMLVTNRGTPAFRLYLKEGFVVEKEFTLKETTLCWMRLTF